MKNANRLVLLIVLGAGLAGLRAMAQTQTGSDPAAPPPPHARGQMLLGILDKYDVNHDGVLDQNELAALKQDIQDGKIGPPPGRGPGMPGGPGHLPKEILDQYDVNHDGKLDDSERAALHADIKAGKIQLPGGPGMFGPPTAKAVLDKFDADKDGKLDEQELTAFLQSMPRHRPGMGRGPGGPPPGALAPQNSGAQPEEPAQQ